MALKFMLLPIAAAVFTFTGGVDKKPERVASEPIVIKKFHFITPFDRDPMTQPLAGCEPASQVNRDLEEAIRALNELEVRLKELQEERLHILEQLNALHEQITQKVPPALPAPAAQPYPGPEVPVACAEAPAIPLRLERTNSTSRG